MTVQELIWELNCMEMDKEVLIRKNNPERSFESNIKITELQYNVYLE